ncbi:hypothetical protein D3C81_1595970 [compost metagenome]
MLVITLLSVFLHGMVEYKAFLFFRQAGKCRESDKTMVSVMAGLSAMFMVAQLMAWGDSPWQLINASVGMSILMAFNFANAFFYLALIDSLTHRKECRSLRAG